VQLLETGFLHADPHPGNFLVTSSGKLCILDYGLMTSIEVDRRIALVEYVTHLLAKDYDATLDDLIVLGFIPETITEDAERRAIVAPLLGQVLGQLSAGGGAKSLNIDAVGQQIETLSKQYPIVIPAYFGLVVRAFGALEGLGLSVDPSYSIVSSCVPYLATRLLSDDSPRVRAALRTFLYGKPTPEPRLNMKRLDQLAEGYRAFSTVSAEAASGKTFRSLKYATATAPVTDSATGTDPVVAAIVKILFSKQGTYISFAVLLFRCIV
jgi:aarF domain-containing kinase